MNHKRDIPKISSILLILLIAICALGVTVHAASARPGTTPPEGMSDGDWAQIKALLPPFQQAYLKASNTGDGDRLGISIAISGDTVVVGAPYEDSNATGVNGDEADNSARDSGAAYVFVRNGTTWSQQAYLKASNTGAEDLFACSLAIDGDTIVVGARNENSNATGVNGDQNNDSASFSGAAYVFMRSGTTWTQQAYLKASNTEYSDWFGMSVAIDGDTIIVGAPYEDSIATGVNGDEADNSVGASGAAYVFARNGTTWSQEAYLKASNTGSMDRFGFSVAIAGDIVTVGAPYEDSNATGVNGNDADNSAIDSGAAYVFVRSGGVWSQEAYLKASNTGNDDEFAASIAISGETAVVGAWLEDSNAIGVNGNETDNSAADSGASYVFVRSSGVWSQEAYLKASNTGWGDRFGIAVAVSGDTVVAGARYEDSRSSGVGGVQEDNSAHDSGAAYVFARSNMTWSQKAYLKASNTEAEDRFGCSVAISGYTQVIGAPLEDSGAVGENGDQNNNLAPDSGVAYVYIDPVTVTTVFRSTGVHDGWILESKEFSNLGGILNSTATTFNLGDETWDRQYRVILSFDTSVLPDKAVITRSYLKIRKQGQVGTNPFTILGWLRVDMRRPFFGKNLALTPSDFQAVPNLVGVANFRTTPTNNWYIAVLKATGYPYILRTGTTQFRLYFTKDDNDDMGADYMRFYSGNFGTVAARPTLVISYYIP